MGMQPTMAYQEISPAAPFARHVMCIWAQEIGPGEVDYPHRVLPDACADLVWIGDRPPIAVGPATRHAIVALAPGTVVVGVRFRPGAVSAALRCGAGELLDREVALRDVIPGVMRRISGIEEGDPVASRLAVVGRAVELLLDGAAPTDELVAAVAGRLAREPQLRVEGLESFTGIGARQLRRRFIAAAGYSPKAFQRVVRFQAALALGRLHGGRNLAGLAACAGYCDQADMAREFRRLSGLAPSGLVARAGTTLGMSGFFKTALVGPQ